MSPGTLPKSSSKLVSKHHCLCSSLLTLLRLRLAIALTLQHVDSYLFNFIRGGAHLPIPEIVYCFARLFAVKNLPYMLLRVLCQSACAAGVCIDACSSPSQPDYMPTHIHFAGWCCLHCLFVGKATDSTGGALVAIYLATAMLSEMLTNNAAGVIM